MASITAILPALVSIGATPTVAAAPTTPPRPSLVQPDTLPTWPDILDTLALNVESNTFNVMLGATLLGLAAGVVGAFALLRKRSLVADALSHAALPGVCLAFLAAAALGMQGRSLPILLLGATTTGVLGVLCIHAIVRFTRLREDAAIGIVLSVFFGAGVVALTYIQKNAAGAAGLNGFIYGQAAAIGRADTILLGAIALAAVLAALLLLKEFTLVCFNDAFARVDGWPVAIIDMAMMALVVAVTVAGMQAVGLILVVALLIIPPVGARFWTQRLWLMVLLAGLIGAICGYLGSAASALFPRQPVGAVIVLVSGAIFTISMLAAPSRGVIATSLRQLRLRLRVAGDHILEAAFEQARDATPPAPPPGSQSVTPHATLTRPDIDRLARLRSWPPGFRTLVIQFLARSRLITPTRSTITPTPAGLARGARVSRNHLLWEQYLISHADIAPSHVDWSVDQVEHVLSEDLVASLEAALRRRGIMVPNAQPTLAVAPRPRSNRKPSSPPNRRAP
ncbi:MAG: iron chelate uptake ABC transporter family permease subunit [Phycisphaerales bacterium]